MIDITKEISQAVDDFSDAMDPVQKKLYNKVVAILKDLTLDEEGNIKITSANIAIINDVKTELTNVVNTTPYQKVVANINSAIDDITDMQTNYFTGVDPDFAVPKVMTAVADQAFSDTVTSLTGAGMDSEVAQAATDIVQNSIMEGGSFADMQDQVEDFIMGDNEVDGKLVSYSRQIVSDAMHTSARKYNSLAVDKLGLEWYMYVGSLKEETRDFCKALIHKKYIHESELGKIARGLIDGVQVSLSGVMEGTDAENIVDRCGGWNCAHHMLPISAEMVPTRIRRQFEDEDDDLEPDEDEETDSRPQHEDED